MNEYLTETEFMGSQSLIQTLTIGMSVMLTNMQSMFFNQQLALLKL